MADTPTAETGSTPTPRPTPSPAAIAERMVEIRQRIEAAGGDDGVTVVAVSKTFPFDHVRAAVEAGELDLGENYGQDLVDKAVEAAQAELGVRWHFIGGLQRNKVKRLAGHVWLWQTVDRDVLVDEIAKRDPGARVLIQVNTTDEPQKSGCGPEKARPLVERAAAAGLQPLGLMTIGPTGPGGTAADPRPAFERLRGLAEACEVTELSMGMSADYELAVAEGATMVRIGSAIFGPRAARP